MSESPRGSPILNIAELRGQAFIEMGVSVYVPCASFHVTPPTTLLASLVLPIMAANRDNEEKKKDFYRCFAKNIARNVWQVFFAAAMLVINSVSTRSTFAV